MGASETGRAPTSRPRSLPAMGKRILGVISLGLLAAVGCGVPGMGGGGGGDDTPGDDDPGGDDQPPTDACPCPSGDGGGGGDGQPSAGCDGSSSAAAQPFGNHAQSYAAGAILPDHMSQAQRDDAVRDFYDAWRDR